MTRRMSSRRVALTATFTMLAMGGVAACDSAEDPNEDGVFYCTDANGVVVAEQYCEDGDDDSGSGGFFFMYMGSSMHTSSTYPVGSRVPAGAQRFSVTDSAARAKYGLPASGFKNGTVKTGVVGKGGPGSSAAKPGSVGKGGTSGGGAKGGSGGG